jgi:hypothetical protein
MDGYAIVPSYGLLIESTPFSAVGPNKNRVFVTTDTQFCPNQIMDFYKQSSLIFQDCETFDLTGKIKSGVHAHYNDLQTYLMKFAPKCGSTIITMASFLMRWQTGLRVL